MTRIGIDIGSTASKVCVIGEDDRPRFEVLPTGWNSKITAGIIKENLEKLGVDLESAKIVATGYGRISVDYADKVITEITCHGRGGYEMAGQEDCSIIDVGGPISSICTVFAESEVINYMGEGRPKEEIAAGVIDSVATKVVTLCQKKAIADKCVITGGLSGNEYFAELLSKKLGRTVTPLPNGRYAGAYGAAILAGKIEK